MRVFVAGASGAIGTRLVLEPVRSQFPIVGVVDDEPATVRDWVPVLARALGAKPPRHFPRRLAGLVAGEAASVMGTESRGASNAKAERELGWTLRHPSWRNGFMPAYPSTTPVEGRKPHPAAGATRAI